MTTIVPSSAAALPPQPLHRAANAAPAPEPADFSSSLAAIGQPHDRPVHAARGAAVSPLQSFEGFVLRTFVESMLPSSENSSFFGSGTAGGIWRSMLAERIGDELAAAGGIGIAEMLQAEPGENPQQAGDARRAMEAATDRLHAASAEREG